MNDIEDRLEGIARWQVEHSYLPLPGGLTFRAPKPGLLRIGIPAESLHQDMVPGIGCVVWFLAASALGSVAFWVGLGIAVLYVAGRVYSKRRLEISVEGLRLSWNMRRQALVVPQDAIAEVVEFYHPPAHRSPEFSELFVFAESPRRILEATDPVAARWLGRMVATVFAVDFRRTEDRGEVTP